MRKIPTLFVRDHRTGFVGPAVTAGCQWVLEGAGHATRKWDGTACRVLDGKLWRRATVKPSKPSPDRFELVEVDLATGKRYGWVPVTGQPDERWHLEAWAQAHAIFSLRGIGTVPDGTYELVGPNVNGNPDDFSSHTLVAHGASLDGAEREDLDRCPRSYSELANYLQARPWEGVVFHHPDGRMAKAKRRDFPLHALALAA